MQTTDLIWLFSIVFNNSLIMNTYFVPSKGTVFFRCPYGKVQVENFEGIGRGLHFYVQGYLLNRNNEKVHADLRNYKEARQITGFSTKKKYLKFIFENQSFIICEFSDKGKIFSFINNHLSIVNSIHNFKIGEPFSLKYYYVDTTEFKRIGDFVEQDFGVLADIELTNSPT